MNCTASSRRRGHAAGFSLLELLVATSMAAVLILSCYAAFSVAFKARETALNSVGPARAGEAAMDILRRDFESALPPTGRLTGLPTNTSAGTEVISGSTGITTGFLGDQGTEVAGTSAVTFKTIGAPAPGFVEEVTTANTGGLGGNRMGGGSGGGGGAPTASNSGNSGFLNNVDTTRAGGIIGVTYLIRTTSSGTRVLVRQLRRNLLPQIENAEPDEESVVCRNVRTFTIRYYDGQQFEEYWDSSELGNILPMAVEVTLELDRPPPAGTSAASSTVSNDQRPYYAAVRTFFPACYDQAAAAKALAGTDSTGGGQ